MSQAPEDRAPTRIITVGGGKGGVGKSIVASNLATAFAQMGKRVVLADLDLGAANQHLLLGITRPKEGVQAVLEGDDDPKQFLTPTSVENLSLLAGSGAVLGAANISHARKQRLLKRLRALEADVVVIDVGAGVGYNAVDFFALGTQKLVVTTPQVTSIHDAYSFLKSAVLRMLWQMSEQAIEAALLEPATLSNESEKVRTILERIREVRPEYADRIFAALKNYNAFMIGNQLQDGAHAGVFRSVGKMINDYLAIDVPLLGCLKASPRVHESVNRRKPVISDQAGEESRLFRQMAEALLSMEAETLDEELEVVVDVPEAPARTERARPSPPPPPPEATAKADPAAAARPIPKVYQPPPRKRRPPAEKRAAEESAPRSKRPQLPGLTPRRNTGSLRIVRGGG